MGSICPVCGEVDHMPVIEPGEPTTVRQEINELLKMPRKGEVEPDLYPEEDPGSLVSKGETTYERKGRRVAAEISQAINTGIAAAPEPTVFHDPHGNTLRAWPVRLFNTALGVPYIANVIDRGNGMVELGPGLQVDLAGARAIRQILGEIVGDGGGE
jgi:hypothetical protein